MSSVKIHIIAGPTASGKSSKALELAAAENGVIINCDSMQIYDDLPILSAQPSKEDREEAPHKLYGILHPNDVCSAGNWREMVIPVIEDVLANDQTPIICGGTGLYIRALMEGLSPMPDIPQDIRTAVVKRYHDMGAEAFYKELEERDPVMAKRFHVNHKARIIRAMEVLETTGKSLAEWQKVERNKPPENWKFEVHKVMPDRAILRQRCDDRFLWMMDNGVMDEVETFDTRLKSGDVREDVPLTKALGFKPLRAYMNGTMSKTEAIEKSQADTRQYAKRQVTWFKNQL